MLYVTRMSHNNSDSISSILQYGRVIDNNCCLVFATLGFLYLIYLPHTVQKEDSYHLLSYKD